MMMKIYVNPVLVFFKGSAEVLVTEDTTIINLD